MSAVCSITEYEVNALEYYITMSCIVIHDLCFRHVSSLSVGLLLTYGTITVCSMINSKLC